VENEVGGAPGGDLHRRQGASADAGVAGIGVLSHTRYRVGRRL
jgi:hypothetical protein